MRRRAAWSIALALCFALACGDDSGDPGPSVDASGDASQGDGPAPGSDAASEHDAPPCQGAACSCPPAMDTRCGDPCTAPESGCLCACGGGGDFTPCGCVGGFFECPSSC